MGNVGHLGLGCSELLDGEWVGDVTLRESLDCVANPPDPLNNTPTPWLTFPDVPGWSAFDINMAVLGVAGTCSKAGALLQSAWDPPCPPVAKRAQGCRLLPKGGEIAQGREAVIRLWPVGI